MLVVLGLTIAAAADARARLPAGGEIAGVAVGGETAAEAERLVSARVEELAAQPLLVVRTRLARNEHYRVRYGVAAEARMASGR